MTRLTDRFTVPVAVHLFLLRGDEILLLRWFNSSYEDGKFSVIAGHLDGGETLLSAMRREAREEAGIELVPKSVEVVGAMHRLSNDERIDFFLTADHWRGEVGNLEPDKCDELRWVPLERLPKNTIPYLATAIGSWRRGEWFNAFGWNEHSESRFVSLSK